MVRTLGTCAAALFVRGQGTNGVSVHIPPCSCCLQVEVQTAASAHCRYGPMRCTNNPASGVGGATAALVLPVPTSAVLHSMKMHVLQCWAAELAEAGTSAAQAIAAELQQGRQATQAAAVA